MIAIGMSDGTLALFDCAKAQKLRSKQICNTAIKSIAFFHKANNQLVVASADLDAQKVTISPKIELVEQLSGVKKRHKKKNEATEILKISPND